jgi:hypothetical protein
MWRFSKAMLRVGGPRAVLLKILAFGERLAHGPAAGIEKA